MAVPHQWPGTAQIEAAAGVQYRLQLTPDVPRGTYVVRVLSSDGVNVESRDVTFTF